MYVCVEIAFHTFLTSALAGSKDEATPVTNRHIQTSLQCTTDETYQLMLQPLQDPKTYSSIHSKAF